MTGAAARACPAARRGVVFAALLIGLAGRRAQSAGDAPASPDYGAPQLLCEVTDARIREASGIAASRRHPGLFYTLNDSGNAPDVFLLDRSGAVRAVIRPSGAVNRDWEDIAIAPRAGGGFDVCVADIGDNRGRRDEVALVRFAEPDLPENPAETISAEARSVRFRYPDGPRDAEGLAIDPASGAAFIFSKRTDGRCDVYLAPAETDRSSVAKHIGSLPFPAGAVPLSTLVTAADISPDGRRLATRSYLCGWEWDLPSGGVRALVASAGEAPRRLVLAPEPKGEALGYSHDGRALLTIGEGAPTAVYEAREE